MEEGKGGRGEGGDNALINHPRNSLLRHPFPALEAVERARAGGVHGVGAVVGTCLAR